MNAVTKPQSMALGTQTNALWQARKDAAIARGEGEVALAPRSAAVWPLRFSLWL